MFPNKKNWRGFDKSLQRSVISEKKNRRSPGGVYENQ